MGDHSGNFFANPNVSPLGGLLFPDKGQSVETTPKWLRDLQKQLGEWSSKGLADFTPGEAYGGNLDFAGKPTDQENRSLQILSSLLNAPNTGGLFGQAENQVSDTLSGKYADPATSPFIKAITNISRRNLGDAISDERGRRGARGTYFTDAGINAESDLTSKSLDTLNALVGQFAQNERQNQLTAVGQAQELDKYKNMTAPLAKIAAGQTYGSLSRTIDQANLESRYQDYLRQRAEKQLPVKTSLGLATDQQNITPGTMQTPVKNPGDSVANIMQIIQTLGPLLGMM